MASKGFKWRVFGNKITTILGTVLGAAVTGAATYYQQTGGTDMNWKNYAAAAAMGAVPVILGGAMTDPGKKPVTE